ncbi:TonB-dependent receptor, partial [Bacteroidota bacterium]
AGQNLILARFNYMNEDYQNQKESLNSSQEYSLSHAGTVKNDIGILFSITSPLSKKHLLTSGMEARAGNVTGQELYRTATDEIYYSGSLGFVGLYIQDEYTLPVEGFKLIAGIRADLASFRNGQQEVVNPSGKTGFPESFQETFTSSSWSAISPKLSLQYSISPQKTAYILTGAGFNPPNIDDLVKSGKIRKGFRLANPALQPEKILNFEAGFKGRIFGDLFMSAALYHSPGRDFHYLVATGDTVDTGGSTLRPVYRRENITRVSVTGLELSIVYSLCRQLSMQSGYSYNHSVITGYAGSESLEGNYLAEVPPHLLYAGVTWQNRLFTLMVDCNYTDSQYADDENKVLLEDHFLVNMKLQTTLLDHLNLYLTCQNIFDVEFIDRKNQLSPGRYIMTGLRYNF